MKRRRSKDVVDTREKRKALSGIINDFYDKNSLDDVEISRLQGCFSHLEDIRHEFANSLIDTGVLPHGATLELQQFGSGSIWLHKGGVFNFALRLPHQVRHLTKDIILKFMLFLSRSDQFVVRGAIDRGLPLIKVSYGQFRLEISIPESHLYEEATHSAKRFLDSWPVCKKVVYFLRELLQQHADYPSKFIWTHILLFAIKHRFQGNFPELSEGELMIQILETLIHPNVINRRGLNSLTGELFFSPRFCVSVGTLSPLPIAEDRMNTCFQYIHGLFHISRDSFSTFTDLLNRISVSIVSSRAQGPKKDYIIPRSIETDTPDVVCEVQKFFENRVSQLQAERARLVVNLVDRFFEDGRPSQWVWNHGLDNLWSSDMNVFVTKMLPLQVDVNHQSSKYGNSCLHRCARAGNTELCSMLIERNALIDPKDRDGWTPLYVYLSGIRSWNDCGKLLLSYGASLPPIDMLAPTHLQYLSKALLEILQERYDTQEALEELRLVPDVAEFWIMSYLYPKEQKLEAMRHQTLLNMI